MLLNHLLRCLGVPKTHRVRLLVSTVRTNFGIIFLAIMVFWATTFAFLRPSVKVLFTPSLRHLQLGKVDGSGFKTGQVAVKPTLPTVVDASPDRSPLRRSGDQLSTNQHSDHLQVKEHSHTKLDVKARETVPQNLNASQPIQSNSDHKAYHKPERAIKKINWAREEIKPVYMKDIFYPSNTNTNASLPASNFTLPHSEPCFRQVHLWRDTGLAASGREGDFFCPNLPCGLRYVIDRNLTTLQDSDVVILYFGSSWSWTQMHSFRPPGQKWIFYSEESPHHAGSHVIPPEEFYVNSYDYIMSYRSSEAHLYASYGYFQPFKTEGERTDHRNWAENKTRSVVWLASNCDLVAWDRKGFVRALSKYIPVSMYGKCGRKSCPRGEKCLRKLRKHKFYLALENSACREYITEKVWKNSFDNNLVPVVYGAPKEDYHRALPPNSFIHVEDFGSVKELAKYLRKLDQDDALYNEYFEWRRLGSAIATTEKWLMEPEQICSVIVKRVLDDEVAMKEGRFQKPTYPDWREWWTNSCLPVDNTSWPIGLR